MNISDRLESIGFFDLIDNNKKRKFLKEKIDFDFNDDSNQFIGKGWLTFPNDYYISSVYKLAEYKNGSPTSDFRSFEVWANSLFRGEFGDYLQSAKVVFEKNNLELEWKNETRIYASHPALRAFPSHSRAWKFTSVQTFVVSLTSVHTSR